jgi:glycosyltransferase involved in cell wall biosynthesis
LFTAGVVWGLMSTYNCYVGGQQSEQTSGLTKSIPLQNTASGTVLLLCAGGIESGGGIGRQMGYFVDEHESKGSKPAYTIVDTRGPRFLNGSNFYTFFAIFYFTVSILRVMWASLSRNSRLAHVNIAGRGSTVRKLIICAAARCVGMSYILHVHDYNYAKEYGRRSALTRFFIRQTFRKAAKILVLGSREQIALSTLMGLPPGKAVVLHNAVPDPRPVKVMGAPGECRFVFLGYLSERKGVPELLHALGSSALRGRRWRAVLAGGGPIDEYRGVATELGIAERVEFPGWLDQGGVRAVCEAADVLVLPSHAEGLAMSVLEGLSYGLPVITTPVGAHTEVIEPEVSGLFVPAGDVEALTAALVRVNDDPALRARLGVAARRRFLEKFDVRGYAEQLARLHEAVVRHKYRSFYGIKSGDFQ